MSETAPQPNAALADAIEKSGLRKGYIAKKLGVHPSMLSHWLRGIRTPSEDQREVLARLLHRSASDFAPALSVVDANHAKSVDHDPEVCTLTESADDGVGEQRRKAAA